MENCFSLDNMVKNVFTEGTSTFRGFNTFDTIKSDLVPTNTIKQSLAISDDTVKMNGDSESCKDAKFRVKETEKNISKNILYSIYTYYIQHGMNRLNFANPLAEAKPIHTYEYTNLDSTNIPTFDKLDMELTLVSNLVNNYGTSGVEDKTTQYYTSLDNMISEIRDLMEGVPSFVMGNKESNISRESFIFNSYRLFRGGDTFKPRTYLSNSKEAAKRFDEINNNYLELSAGVASYNKALKDMMLKLEKVLFDIKKPYRTYNEQLSRQIQYKKEELATTLCKFAYKYFNYTNILYSIKSDAIREYLNPSENEEGTYTRFVKEESVEDILGDDNGFITEDYSDLDDMNFTTEYEFTDKMNYLEAEFLGYTTQEIINEMNGNESQPQQGASNPNPGQQSQTGQTGGQAQQQQPGQSTTTTASATNKFTTTIKNATNTVKEVVKKLWEKISTYFASFFTKVNFKLKKMSDTLLGIIGDDDKINAIKQSLAQNQPNSKKVYKVSALPTEVATANNLYKAMQFRPLEPKVIKEINTESSDTLFISVFDNVCTNNSILNSNELSLLKSVYNSKSTEISFNDAISSALKHKLIGSAAPINQTNIDRWASNKDTNGGYEQQDLPAKVLLAGFDGLIISLRELYDSLNKVITNINTSIDRTKKNMELMNNTASTTPPVTNPAANPATTAKPAQGGA